MSRLTIDQVKELKKSLAKHIAYKIQTFERETDLEVTAIDWQRSNAIGHKGKLVGIDIEAILKG